MVKSPGAEIRRYLAPVDTLTTQQFFTDCLVIGSGVAGLRAAIEAAAVGTVTLVSKGSIDQSNTWDAQGGIAAVLDSQDSFDKHIADTLATGAGLCDRQVVSQVIRQAPELIGELISWGTEFDRVNGVIDATFEGGHSFARVIHSHGDSTGRGIAEGLLKKLRSCPTIRTLEHFFVIDLLTGADQECCGAIGWQAGGTFQIIWAARTILATGGAGRLYRETTNPENATADGLAMAYRAGAVLRDLEFMQFHPTTLYIAGASRALITETLRGEGAILRDKDGYAFMKDYHSDGELAPRDVVSRAIVDHMHKTGATHVYLDIRHFDKEHFQKRFPFISELCDSFDIDVSKDMIPVRPSAHYMVGGIKVDSEGATNIANLYACGEAASTGLHGANRLGSNSLLEGLVYGRIAGQSAARGIDRSRPHRQHSAIEFSVPQSNRSRLDTEDVRNSLRALMWRNVGISRQESLLVETQEIIRFWQRYVMDKVFHSPAGWECQNMLTVAWLMARSAELRRESRGVHYRADFPAADDVHFLKHIEVSCAD